MKTLKNLAKLVLIAGGVLLLTEAVTSVVRKGPGKDYSILKSFTREGRIEKKIYNKSIIENPKGGIFSNFTSRFLTKENEREYILCSQHGSSGLGSLGVYNQYNHLISSIGALRSYDYFITTIKRDDLLMIFTREHIGLGVGLRNTEVSFYDTLGNLIAKLPYSQLEDDLQVKVKEEYNLFLKSNFLEKLTNHIDSLETERKKKRQVKIKKQEYLSSQNKKKEYLSSQNKKIKEKL